MARRDIDSMDDPDYDRFAQGPQWLIRDGKRVSASTGEELTGPEPPSGDELIRRQWEILNKRKK